MVKEQDLPDLTNKARVRGPSHYHRDRCYHYSKPTNSLSSSNTFILLHPTIKLAPEAASQQRDPQGTSRERMGRPYHQQNGL